MRLVVETRYFYNDGKAYGADLRIEQLYSSMDAEVTVVVQGRGLKESMEKRGNLKVIRTPCIYPFHFLTRLPSLGRLSVLLREAKDADVI